MRTALFIITAVLLSLSGACKTTSDNITAPALPGLKNMAGDSLELANMWECRSIMRDIFGRSMIFYANHGFYPNTLIEIGMADVVCPSCNLPHRIISTETECHVICPISSYSKNHGLVSNGVPSWPAKNPDGCRANMITIASQCVIYFARHNTFPNSLADINMAHAKCSTCNLPYEFSGNANSYFIRCPIPSYATNHGFIDNGIPSWHNHNTVPNCIN